VKDKSKSGRFLQVDQVPDFDGDEAWFEIEFRGHTRCGHPKGDALAGVLSDPCVMARVDDQLLARITPALAGVPGVGAVVLGGSRARGTATENSDYDLGLYFRRGRPLDTEAVDEVITDASAGRISMHYQPGHRRAKVRT
jgi:predicted nucleotidyltransferase